MADEQERVNIITLEIDQDEALKDLATLSNSINQVNKDIKSLERQQQALQKEGKKNSTQYKKNAQEIELQRVNAKSLRKEYNAQQKVVSEVLTSNEKQLGTLQKLTKANKALRQEQRELNLESEEGLERNEEINDALEENTDIINENSDGYVQQKMNIGNYQSALDGLPPGLNKAKGGILAMTKAAKAFLATPLGIIIAAIAGAVALMSKAFKGSQGLMDEVSVGAKSMGASFKVVIDRVGDGMEKAFARLKEEPLQAVTDLGRGIVERLVNRVKALPQIFIKAFEAVKHAIKGNSDEAKESLEELGQAFIQLTSGFDPEKQKEIAESVKEVTKEMFEESKAAEELQRAFIELQEEEIRLIVSNEKLRREREKNRLLAKDEQFSAEERIKAQERTIEIDQQLLRQELNHANERVRIMKEQQALGKTTREQRQELAELQAEAIRLETLFFSRNKEITTELNTLRNKIAGEDKARTDARIAQIRSEAEELEAFLNNNVLLWEAKNQSVIAGEKELTEALVQEETTRLETLSMLRLDVLETSLADGLITQQEYELQRMLIILEANQQIALINTTFADQQASEAQKHALRLNKLEQDVIGNRLDSRFTLERERLEQWYDKQRELAQGNNAEITKLDLAHSLIRRQIALDEFKARANAVQGMVKNVQSLFEEGTDAYKATATAAIAIDTIKGAIAAYSSLAGIPIVGPALGVVAAGLVTAAGAKAIQKVWSVDAKSGSSGVDSPVSGGGVSIPSAQTTSDGGLVVRDAEASMAESVKGAFLEALIEAPVKDVAIIDQITRDQNNQAAIENLASV